MKCRRDSGKGTGWRGPSVLAESRWPRCAGRSWWWRHWAWAVASAPRILHPLRCPVFFLPQVGPSGSGTAPGVASSTWGLWGVQAGATARGFCQQGKLWPSFRVEAVNVTKVLRDRNSPPPGPSWCASAPKPPAPLWAQWLSCAHAPEGTETILTSELSVAGTGRFSRNLFPRS